MIVFASAFAISFAVLLLYWVLVTGRPSAHDEVVGNLALGISPSSHVMRSSAAGEGAASRLDAWVRSAAPRGAAARLERQLTLLGRDVSWPLHRVLLGKLAVTALIATLGLTYVFTEPTGGRILSAFAVTLVGYYAPELILHSRGQERQQRIQRELADTLDQMTIAVEAGLSFDAAMQRAAKNGKGPLAEELIRTMQDMQVGVPRRKAMKGLANRSSVADLRRFVTALLQADAYGIPLADVLRTQAVEMRLKRRQRAEQKAMQIPVKVVFPLILFILPTLFIVLLGPAVMSMIEAFSS